MDILNELKNIADFLDDTGNTKCANSVTNVMQRLAQNSDFISTYNPDEDSNDFWDLHESDPQYNLTDDGLPEEEQAYAYIDYLVSKGHQLKDIKNMDIDSLEDLATSEGYGMADLSNIFN